ncbi:hypothetical protein AB4090_13115 [Acidithiobacillus sp. IBUN Pt1247-S3]|uniref:hypothetical protein n=1 Tax=Acidithiobacillus sp. IBUN Pt1247-S3 TaxID=3166642 RepID=UPI0034E39BD9
MARAWPGLLAPAQECAGAEPIERMQLRIPAEHKLSMGSVQIDAQTFQKIRVYRSGIGRFGAIEAAPWWRYPRARWGGVPRTFLSWLNNPEPGENDWHRKVNPSHLWFVGKLTSSNYRLAAEVWFAEPVMQPIEALREVLDSVERMIPFVPQLGVADLRLALRLLRGESTREISAQMELTASMVYSRVWRLCRIFGAKNRAELMQSLWQVYQRNSHLFTEVSL